MTDDVFETMTRVKRHFSDTTMHIKQVDFSGADRAEKIKTQFKGVVGEVLSRGLPESAAAKNVTLIEDFFLTFDRADPDSVHLSKEELFGIVKSKLRPGQECRLAFMDESMKQSFGTGSNPIIEF